MYTVRIYVCTETLNIYHPCAYTPYIHINVQNVPPLWWWVVGVATGSTQAWIYVINSSRASMCWMRLPTALCLRKSYHLPLVLHASVLVTGYVHAAACCGDVMSRCMTICVRLVMLWGIAIVWLGKLPIFPPKFLL